MSLYIPRLSRATSDYLQLASREAVAALEVIEESLYDARTVDSVYQLIISQASKEPFSPVLVKKFADFIRKYITRFRPGLETLCSISQFCSCALTTFETGEAHERKELQRSLHFLQSLVDHVSSDSPSISASCQSSDDSNLSLKPSVSLSRARSWESSTPNGLHDSENGGGESLSASSTGGQQSNAFNNARMANSLGGGGGGGSSVFSSENLSSAIRRTRTPVIDPSTPARRLETTMRGMWSSSMWSGLPSGGGTGDYQMHRRSRSGSLADKFTQEMLNFRPPQIWMNQGLSRSNSESEGENWLSVANMKGLMCLEHLWTVVDHQHGLSMSENRRSGSHSLGSTPLFQYKSYREQGRLDLDASVISLIVDTVCGSTVHDEASIWGEVHLADLWEPSKSIGEACVTILVKLIMDMYLKTGPGLSYVLILQMLHRSLLNPSSAVRVRAFDFVYNLALHSSMMSNTPDGSLFEQKTPIDRTIERRRDQSNRNSRDLERNAIPKLHTLKEETEQNSEQEVVFEMIPWVRSLLFDLMVIITELDEQDKQVWTAAIGCFLHLTTNDGEFLWTTIQNFPFSVIKQILKKCAENGWCDEVYVRFVRLFVCLVYDCYEKGDRRVNEVRLLQGGGIDEVLFHLHHIRSTEAATWLLQLLIDYASQKTNCNQEALSPVLSHLMSPSAVDVIVSQCRYGSHGIGDTFRTVLQNCVTEKQTTSQDSPKNPVHHRHKTQSSFMSSDTTGSLAPGLDPESLEAWISVLNKIDTFLCRRPSVYSTILQHLGEPANSATSIDGHFEIDWNYLREVLLDPDHETRLASIHWIRDHCMAQLDSCLQLEDSGSVSLLPSPSSPESELSKVLVNWIQRRGSSLETGFELSHLLDEFVSSLINLNSIEEQSDANSSTSWIRVRKLGTVLFQTLQSGLGWIKLMPLSLRRPPLVSMGYQICQVVRSPQTYADVSSTPQSDGVVCVPGPFVYNDYIFGTSAVYIHLLRLAPIDFLLELISDLKEFCPAYNKEECVDGLGFFGRPGHKSRMRSTQGSMPWTDTVSDIRSALTLLLLHRCSMDSKGTMRLESICRSLLEDEDVRVQYLSSRYLLKHVMEEKSTACRTALRQFVVKAQQMNNERLVDNPYLQVKHILESEDL